MSSVSGAIASKSRNGTGIKIGNDWYNGTAAVLAAFNWKDNVVVEFDEGRTGKGAITRNITSIEAMGGGSSAPAAAGGGANDSRQKAIMYQSSRKDAVEVASALLGASALPMPAKADAKYDAFLAVVDDLTDRFYGECCDVIETGELPNREQG